MDDYDSMSTGGNGSIPQMPKPVSPDMERLAHDLRRFIADCETLFHNATTLSGAGAQIARAQLSEGMAAAKLKFDAIRTTATDRAARARECTEDYVRREPIKAIACAAGAGAVLGMLMSRR